jgi:hypothetical protein
MSSRELRRICDRIGIIMEGIMRSDLDRVATKYGWKRRGKDEYTAYSWMNPSFPNHVLLINHDGWWWTLKKDGIEVAHGGTPEEEPDGMEPFDHEEAEADEADARHASMELEGVLGSLQAQSKKVSKPMKSKKPMKRR